MKRSKLFEKYLTKNILFVLRLIIGILFILSSFNDLYNPEYFRTSILMYKILPVMLASITAIVLPWLEFVCGILIILNVHTKSSALILSVILVAFIGAISLNLVRGYIHDCGCFNIFGFKENISIFVVIRDIVLLCFTVVLSIKGEKK
ncbi:MAG: MauE/DoxX family redox-associated membrane protein [Candidatus Firestonebacteria bacterium]